MKTDWQEERNNVKYLAILGGNDLAIPAVKRLVSLGYKLLIVDGNSQCAAKNYADVFLHCDFSDVGSTESHLSEFELDGIISLNDFGVASAAHIARQRGLPGLSEFSQGCVTSKIQMKRVWLDNQVHTAQATFSTVKLILDGQFPDWDIWPCIVKPDFSGGGSRGVFYADDWLSVQEKLSEVKNQYLNGGIVIEEFIQGSEHTIEVIVYNGTPQVLSISDKENYSKNYTVVQTLYFPGPIGNRNKVQISQAIHDACRAMEFYNGAFHFEVILRGKKIYLLEVGGRPGGGLNFHPICELSTGFNYPEILAFILTGKEVTLKKGKTNHLVWRYFETGTGVLNKVEGFDEVSKQLDVVDAKLYETIGKKRSTLEDDLKRPGYILVRGENHSKVSARAIQLTKSVKFFSDGSGV